MSLASASRVSAVRIASSSGLSGSAPPFHTRFVLKCLVKSTHLAFQAGWLMTRVGRAPLHQRMQARLGEVRHQCSKTEGSLVRWNRCTVEPAPIYEAKEVVSRFHRAVFTRRVEAPCAVVQCSRFHGQ